jgi:hypothetical protein
MRSGGNGMWGQGPAKRKQIKKKSFAMPVCELLASFAKSV